MINAPQDESLLASLAALGATPGADQDAQTYTVTFADGHVVHVPLGATPAEFLDAAVKGLPVLESTLESLRNQQAVDAAAVAAEAEKAAADLQAFAEKTERSVAAALADPAV